MSVDQNPLVVDSKQVNRTLDATEHYMQQMARGGKGDPHRNIPQPCFIKVKNNSGGDLARGKVLQLGTLLLTDKSNDFLWFNADIPEDPQATARSCILRDPILDGKIGRAQVGGACLALVNVSDADHTFASPVDSASSLASGTSGIYELLSPVSGTGEQEVVVRYIGQSGFGRIKGTLVGAMETTDGTHTIDNIVVLSGADPRTDPTSTSEAITFTNDRALYGHDNGLFDLVWDATNGLWKPAAWPEQGFEGKTDASHAKGATGTISVWLNGSDTGENVTATNRYADLDSGAWVAVMRFGTLWILVSGECPEP